MKFAVSSFKGMFSASSAGDTKFSISVVRNSSVLIVMFVSNLFSAVNALFLLILLFNMAVT
jgi:hypothetical protein